MCRKYVVWKKMRGCQAVDKTSRNADYITKIQLEDGELICNQYQALGLPTAPYLPGRICTKMCTLPGFGRIGCPPLPDLALDTPHGLGADEHLHGRKARV